MLVLMVISDQLLIALSGGVSVLSSLSILQALYRPSVLLSVCPSVHHVLCQNEGTQRDAVFAIG